ncbi:MAG: M81 family metallopeptidase [Pirellulales bacterium]|nr:M81 family metallopeptidase [Pirellulales bacterium]
MRVGIVALLQETNTFAPGVTTRRDFAADVLLHGEAIRERFRDAHHEVGGFFAGLQEAGVEAVPLFAARAVPWGPLCAADYGTLRRELIGTLAAAGPLDGILAAAHGATVSENVLDVDGDWLSAVRQALGPDAPLIATLDPHANLSPAMTAACTALVAYRTNPHLDQRDCGIEAASLMARTLQGEVRPCLAAAFLPLVIAIEAQHTAESPCREWFAQAEDARYRDDVLAANALLGFPYADVPELGASTIVVTDNAPNLAKRLANELADHAWLHRQQFQRQSMSIATAIEKAAVASGPICLLDMGDNIGGGGPADATELAHAIRHAAIGPSLVCLCDADFVAIAQQAGIGAQVTAAVGGKHWKSAGLPLCGTWTVKNLTSGRFAEAKPRHGGFTEFDQGATAVVTDGSVLTLIVTSRRMPPYSLSQITSCGLDPSLFRILVAKGVHAPTAAYREVCSQMIRVDTPGSTAADFTRLEYHRRRRPLYPWEDLSRWNDDFSTNAEHAPLPRDEER